MVELPTGSLVGLCILCAVVGIVLGRSSRFMARMGRMHAAAHGGDSKASATGGHADQRVQTVVVVDRDGVPRSADGRYDLDALEGDGRAFGEDRWETVRGELVEADDAYVIHERAAEYPLVERVER